MSKSGKMTHSDWLSTEEEKVRRKQCSICSNDELKDIVDAHLDALAEGRTKISLKHMYDNFLMVRFPVLPAYPTIRAHCRKCLRRNALTGMNVDEIEDQNEQETT